MLVGTCAACSAQLGPGSNERSFTVVRLAALVDVAGGGILTRHIGPVKGSDAPVLGGLNHHVTRWAVDRPERNPRKIALQDVADRCGQRVGEEARSPWSRSSSRGPLGEGLVT
jgi:hypothetical protein